MQPLFPVTAVSKSLQENDLSLLSLHGEQRTAIVRAQLPTAEHRASPATARGIKAQRQMKQSLQRRLAQRWSKHYPAQQHWHRAVGGAPHHWSLARLLELCHRQLHFKNRENNQVLIALPLKNSSLFPEPVPFAPSVLFLALETQQKLLVKLRKCTNYKPQARETIAPKFF